MVTSSSTPLKVISVKVVESNSSILLPPEEVATDVNPMGEAVTSIRLVTVKDEPAEIAEVPTVKTMVDESIALIAHEANRESCTIAQSVVGSLAGVKS